jgi:hypothetical protein
MKQLNIVSSLFIWYESYASEQEQNTLAVSRLYENDARRFLENSFTIVKLTLSKSDFSSRIIRSN